MNNIYYKASGVQLRDLLGKVSASSLPFSQWIFLSQAALGTQTPTDIARELGQSLQCVYPAYKQLLTAGFIEVLPSDDKRQRRCQLTEAGRALLNYILNEPFDPITARRSEHDA